MRDNAELKKISVNQARVAVVVSRDSAAMRVIAAITTVFLPATFTAVLAHRYKTISESLATTNEYDRRSLAQASSIFRLAPTNQQCRGGYGSILL